MKQRKKVWRAFIRMYHWKTHRHWTKIRGIHEVIWQILDIKDLKTTRNSKASRSIFRNRSCGCFDWNGKRILLASFRGRTSTFRQSKWRWWTNDALRYWEKMRHGEKILEIWRVLRRMEILCLKYWVRTTLLYFLCDNCISLASRNLHSEGWWKG